MLALPAHAQDPAPGAASSTDQTFLELRDAARQDKLARVQMLAPLLPNHEFAAYVDYYLLKTRLKEATSAEIADFLVRHAGNALTDRIRNDWLLELGRRRDFAAFDQVLPQFVLNDDLQVKCYALLSRAVKGERVAVEARALLLDPSNYGEACGTLITTLHQSTQFDTNDLLAQLRLAGEDHATGPARRIAGLLGGSETRAAQAVDFPALVVARGVGSDRVERELYLVAVGRLARTSLSLAAISLNKNTARLSEQERAVGWSNVALAASLKLAPEANDYWLLTSGAPLTREAAQWKTRIALRHGQWERVRATIEGMPAPLRDESAWSYWLARSLQASAAQHPTRAAEALALYRRIADQNSFYGQLAMEELGQSISIPPAAAPPTAAESALVAANPALRRAIRMYALGMRAEGNREWNWETRKMSERELLAAGEFARQNNLLDRMVYTSERTRTLFDYTQRFPSPHNEVLHPTVQNLGLDKAWVYGLIRQESRFVQDARSHVGASGLMQVMPATGDLVARKIGLGGFVHSMLNDMRTNILLGSNYLNMVLNNVDGSQPLATAGYNAGPGRARTWRRLLTAPMEGAVFIESIPFQETRVYVKNVMANATNYAALFENKPQSLKARIGQISPRDGSAPDLP
ncbi:MAG: transglycosylase SLT domain-containing protein [Pseudomonadota bacterium]